MAISHHTFQRLCRNQRGAVAILFGLAIMGLCAALGLAFDSARGYTAKSKLQGAVDAAALAAGRTFGLDQATVVEDATSYFNANYQSGFLSGALAEFDVDVNEDNEEITVAATAIIPTSIMQIFGKDSMTVSAEAVAIAQHHQLELSLVVDVTGSMLDTDDSGIVKIESLQSAAHEMVEILYGDSDTVPNIWLSIVPFTTRACQSVGDYAATFRFEIFWSLAAMPGYQF